MYAVVVSCIIHSFAPGFLVGSIDLSTGAYKKSKQAVVTDTFFCFLFLG